MEKKELRDCSVQQCETEQSSASNKVENKQSRVMAKKRKCTSCGELKNKENLIKITRQNQTGAIFINPNSKIFGRSAYLCYNNCCIENAFKKNKLQRAVKAVLPKDLKGKLNELGKY